ncbi:unnamed protein product [Urochloa humidicola]
MADEGPINHFSHPGHELVKRYHTGTFRCDMCLEDLSDLAYGCRAGCDFAIHDTFVGHPQALLSPEHHPHELVLVQTRRDAALACDICAGRCAAGCFLYRCPPCGFDMHPRCARLPPVVRSARHHHHDLTLVAADKGRCAACNTTFGAARAWYYRCTMCSNLEFHISCAAAGGGGEEKAAGGGALHGDTRAGDVHGELVLARLKAQRDINYARAIANIQARGFDAAAGHKAGYRTTWF